MWSLPEIEADFLAVYHRDVRLIEMPRRTPGLSGPRFLNLCEHLAAYPGAVRMAALRWEQERESEAEVAGALMLDPDIEVTRA